MVEVVAEFGHRNGSSKAVRKLDGDESLGGLRDSASDDTAGGESVESNLASCLAKLCAQIETVGERHDILDLDLECGTNGEVLDHVAKQASVVRKIHECNATSDTR